MNMVYLRPERSSQIWNSVSFETWFGHVNAYTIALSIRRLTCQWTDMMCLSWDKVTALSMNEQLAFGLVVYSLLATPYWRVPKAVCCSFACFSELLFILDHWKVNFHVVQQPFIHILDYEKARKILLDITAGIINLFQPSASRRLK